MRLVAKKYNHKISITINFLNFLPGRLKWGDKSVQSTQNQSCTQNGGMCCYHTRKVATIKGVRHIFSFFLVHDYLTKQQNFFGGQQLIGTIFSIKNTKYSFLFYWSPTVLPFASQSETFAQRSRV